jgi:adenine-specific DNA-methyltransferase
MAKQYKGSLSLEWFNKQKAIVNLDENSIKSENDIPAPRINWINKEEALFYELNQEEGKGNTPYWVNRDDIRVKESRPLVFQKAFRATEKDKKGTIPGTEKEFVIEEITKEDEALDIENILIKGDNLLALNILKKHFDKLPDSEKVKCIYIDPPYNTGSAFEHYDDNIEHSEWLTLMRDRLTILQELLSDDGFLVAQIDDKEFAYLYILISELFGRENVKTICVKMSEPTGVKMSHVISSGILPKLKEYLIIARKDGVKHLDIERVAKESWDNEYKTLLKNISKEEIQFLKEVRDDEARNENNIKKVDEILAKVEFESLSGFCENQEIKLTDDFKYENAWRIAQVVSMTGGGKNLADEKKLENPESRAFSICTKQNKMYFIKSDYDTSIDTPRIKLLFADDYLMVHPGDFWADIKTTGLDNEGNVDMKKSKKPEKLIYRILKMCSYENDLILDIFGGSGTTFSVAHKMKRRWIGVELGNHADTLIIPRLKGVLINNDQSPLIADTNWKGGGSFKYYHLGESIINVDKETGKGEFNWSLGKQFIQESLLTSYDFVVQKDIDVFPAQIFKDDTSPTVGKLIGKSNKSIYGLSFLVAPNDKNVTISNEEIKSIYNEIRKQSDFQSLVIYTNKGIDIAQDTIPQDLDIIKVPHAIFAELER